MTRNIFIIRHAKAADPYQYDTDYERPLNKRGKSDAPMMGKRLLEKNIIPDLIISSTAARATETAIAIANEVNYNEDNMLWRKDLYHAPMAYIDQVLSEALDKTTAKNIFIVAHNFGVTDYVNEKVNNFSIDNLPTCGIVGFALEKWENNNLSIKGKLIFYDYPKNL